MRILLLCIASFTAVLLTVCPREGHAADRLIAAIMSSDQPRYRDAHRSFVKTLAARGYSAATTEIILQSPNPDSLSWSNTIRKFNAYKPDLILAYGAPAALVAMKESAGIPVVSADIYATGKPVKGLCGVSSRVPMITLLKTLQDITPYQRVGILYTTLEAGSKRQADDLKQAAMQLGVHVVEGDFATSAALAAGLHKFVKNSDVIIATESYIVSHNFDHILKHATEQSKPVASTMPDSAEKGALVSLEISPQEQGRLAAEIAITILQGTDPEHLSLVAPRRIDLIVNLRVARKMGINLPFSVLGNATRVLK